MAESLPVKPGIVLDLLDTKSPALSATDDMPVVETKPDASPAPPQGGEEEVDDKAATPATEAEGQDTDAQSASAPTEELPGAPEGEKKPARGVQKKLDELRRNAEDAKREAQAERQEKLRLLALLEAQGKAQPKEEPRQEAEPARPARADYADEAQWVEAMSAYAESMAGFIARREVAKERNRMEEESRLSALKSERARAIEAYRSRVEKAREKHADFDEVAYSDVQISTAIAAAIEHSDDGPELQYYLGANPAEAERLNRLSAPLQLVELGKIALKLATPATSERPQAPLSAAPRPPKPLKGVEQQPVKDPSEMSMDEYAAMRKTQQKEERKGMRR
jgi:hypothetical protein